MNAGELEAEHDEALAMLAELRDAAARLVPMGQGLTPEAARVVVLLTSKIDATATRYRARVAAEGATTERNRVLRRLHGASVRLADGTIGDADVIGWPDVDDVIRAEAERRERGGT